MGIEKYQLLELIGEKNEKKRDKPIPPFTFSSTKKIRSNQEREKKEITKEDLDWLGILYTSYHSPEYNHGCPIHHLLSFNRSSPTSPSSIHRPISPIHPSIHPVPTPTE